VSGLRPPLAAVDQLEAELREQMRTGSPRLLTPLPRRVRLRLAVRHVLTVTGMKLMDHGHTGTAARLWRVTGLIR
jgi:hypothetical protein